MLTFQSRFLAIIIAVTLLLLPQVGLSDEKTGDKEPWEKFGINLGVFVSNLDSTIRLGAGVGTDIDTERLLGLDSDTTVFRTDMLWRFSNNRRHRLDLTWLSYNRSGDNTITEDITIENPETGDEIRIPSGTKVEAFLDLDIFELAYSYSIIQDDRLDLAAGVGLYVMPIDFGLKVSGLIGNEGDLKFTAPLPVFGLRMDVAITPEWFIKTGSQIFYLEYKDFKGSVLEFRGALEYNPWKHVGIGLGFDTLNVNIEGRGEDWPGVDLNGKVGFKYIGVQLYLHCFF